MNTVSRCVFPASQNSVKRKQGCGVRMSASSRPPASYVTSYVNGATGQQQQPKGLNFNSLFPPCIFAEFSTAVKAQCCTGHGIRTAVQWVVSAGLVWTFSETATPKHSLYLKIVLKCLAWKNTLCVNGTLERCLTSPSCQSLLLLPYVTHAKIMSEQHEVDPQDRWMSEWAGDRVTGLLSREIFFFFLLLRLDGGDLTRSLLLMRLTFGRQVTPSQN